jgi:hypothetical protein
LAHFQFLTQLQPTSPLPRAGPPASRPSGLRPSHPAFPSPPSLTCGPRPRLIGPPPVSRAMARSRPTAPSSLTPPLWATSTSPSSGNWHTPPSMVSPSLHRRLVASLPFGTYKRHPGRASSRCTPHRPLFLLSHTGARPHCAPSTVIAPPHRPAASSPLTLR